MCVCVDTCGWVGVFLSTIMLSLCLFFSSSLFPPTVLHDRVLPIGPLDPPPSCQVHYSLPNKVQVFRQRLIMSMKAFKEKVHSVHSL